MFEDLKEDDKTHEMEPAEVLNQYFQFINILLIYTFFITRLAVFQIRGEEGMKALIVPLFMTFLLFIGHRNIIAPTSKTSSSLDDFPGKQ